MSERWQLMEITKIDDPRVTQRDVVAHYRDEPDCRLWYQVCLFDSDFEWLRWYWVGKDGMRHMLVYNIPIYDSLKSVQVRDRRTYAVRIHNGIANRSPLATALRAAIKTIK